jgi:DNA-nicking Smr family endonuclease
MKQCQKSTGKDKSPYNRREEKDDKKAFKSVAKSVKPVAKDTNKTRRKVVKPTEYGTRSPKAGSPVYRKGKNGD